VRQDLLDDRPARTPEASGGRVLDGRQQATPVVTTGAVGAPPNRSTR